MASAPRSLTTSVARKARASAIRSGRRPMMTICSAPRRFAAITPHRPTAPSPTTATLLPGRDTRYDRSVMTCPHHVRERQQRRHQRGVSADAERVERPVAERDADRFGLGAAVPAVADEADVDARG